MVHISTATVVVAAALAAAPAFAAPIAIEQVEARTPKGGLKKALSALHHTSNVAGAVGTLQGRAVEELDARAPAKGRAPAPKRPPPSVLKQVGGVAHVALKNADNIATIVTAFHPPAQAREVSDDLEARSLLEKFFKREFDIDELD
ncbi:hypothetical protein D9611_009124 [Ephemerocybe angulata]|uniref:Uncharacterized protein n=1 Tax=Ephemerocybe angulata TaxID=980116 RepID=A0A8H5CFX3_9AGAR|nr:hypothetical protein D9611_009124 [Tulosesus angulatus]